MPAGIPQSLMYGRRGQAANGMPIRNMSAEQQNTTSGNPGMPIYNTAANAMPNIQYPGGSPSLAQIQQGYDSNWGGFTGGGWPGQPGSNPFGGLFNGQAPMPQMSGPYGAVGGQGGSATPSSAWLANQQQALAAAQGPQQAIAGSAASRGMAPNIGMGQMSNGRMQSAYMPFFNQQQQQMQPPANVGRNPVATGPTYSGMAPQPTTPNPVNS